MVRQLKFLFQLFLFWIGYYFLLRLIFLVFVSISTKTESFAETIRAFWFGLSMDMAASIYVITIPVLIYLIWLFIPNNKWQKSFRVFNFIMISFSSFLNSTDIGLFGAWGTRINSKALSYIAFPKEAIMSSSGAPIFLLLAIMLLISLCGIILFKKLIRLPQNIHLLQLKNKIIIITLVIPLMFVLVRGGVQTHPLNRGWAYYSDKSSLNMAAVNTFWNFFEHIVNPRITQNPYIFMNQKTAETITQSIFSTPSDSTSFLFNIKHPNIVLILMESLSAEASSVFGNEKGITPGLDSLCKKGLAFTDFYATGFRTEQGLIALLSAFPAQPVTTIIRNFGKFELLDKSTKQLKEAGYKLSYYYGGELSYANTDHYLRSGGVTHLVGHDDFGENTPETDWGVYDEVLFKYHLQRTDLKQEPFFSVLMTSTNHEPFNAKVDAVFSGERERSAYKNTARYSDKCLYEYIENAKTKPWYSNTVFIITADHAHKYPNNRPYNSPERHHIPFLIFGEPLKKEYHGKKINKTASHLDFIATIFAQLDIPKHAFPWSRNLMNPACGNFAFYAFDNGFGVINEKQAVIYDYNAGRIIYRRAICKHSEDEELLMKGKAFLQVMFKKFIELDY